MSAKRDSAGKKSKALFERAARVLPGGVSSPVRAFKAVGGTPLFFKRGRGARLEDADGRTYLDYCGSWGALALGHAHPKVVRAAVDAIKRGSTFGAPTEPEVRLAEKLTAALPSVEVVRFTSSGTEAVMSALRLARAATGRDKVLKFSGCYHGHADSLLSQAGSGLATLGVPDSAGVPQEWARDTLTLPYNDLDAVLELFGRLGDKIAAVIVEPVAANMGVVPPKEGYLEGLRKITRAHGALLIFDEVITGFRVAYGGAQTLLGIEPDLTTLGKVIGGGLPVGAYGGRRELMERLAPLGPVYQAGTLSGNPAVMAAGLETLTLLEKTRPYPRMAARAQELANRIRSAAIESVAPVQVNVFNGMLTVFLSEHPVSDYTSAKRADAQAYAALFHGLLKEGVYFPPAQFEAAFVSAAHTDRDIVRTAEAFRAAFAAAAPRARKPVEAGAA